jgi:hypothetical protein
MNNPRINHIHCSLLLCIIFSQNLKHFEILIMVLSLMKMFIFLALSICKRIFQRWATGWTIRVLVLDSRRGLGIFLFTTASRTALGPTQSPIQWVPGALSLWVKRPEREADQSPPSIAEVKGCVGL